MNTSVKSKTDKMTFIPLRFSSDRHIFSMHIFAQNHVFCGEILENQILTV